MSTLVPPTGGLEGLSSMRMDKSRFTIYSHWHLFAFFTKWLSQWFIFYLSFCRNTSAGLRASSSSKASPSSAPHSMVNPAQVCRKVIPSAPADRAPESSSCAQDCRDAQVRSGFHAAAASHTSNTHCQAAAKKATLQGSKCSKGKKRKAQTSTSQGNINQFIVSWYSKHLPEFMPCMGIDSSK